MAKRADIRERLEAYRLLCEREGPETVLAATRKSLRDPHRLLVARAADLAGERLLYVLESDLIAAFRHFLEDPLHRDPGCTAKGAIARALVTLDCANAAFFLGGIGYRQFEPVWGGSVDTAVDLRSSCAIGLAATGDTRAAIHLVDLLHDPEPHVRAAAVRAVACTQPLTAEALLRAKALAGDSEPEVVGECLSALMRIAGEDSLDFVARFLDAPDPELAGLAALALGESHLDSALAVLRERWEAQPFKRPADRVLLRAAALHRSPAALDWLLDVAASGDRLSAGTAVDELSAFRSNSRVAERLPAILAERDDIQLKPGPRPG
jgi:HEAT repeat protein